MPGVAVVADSSACLPADILEQYGIITVPLTFLLGGELCRDGAFSSAEFFRRLREASTPAVTNAPAPGEFLQAFRQARDAGAQAVLCLTLSSEYSGTYSSARNAAEMATRELPGLPVRAVDTGGLAMVHGFAVLAAARAARAGAGLDEAAAAAVAAASRGHLVGALDTMRYLAKSGRVPWIVHWAASALQIKPILAAEDGRVEGIGRVRTMARAIDRLLGYVAERTRQGGALHVAVMHSDAAARAQELARRVRESFAPAELMVTEFTSVMGVHTGPGFVGLAFYSGEGEAVANPSRAAAARERDVRRLEQSLGALPAPGAAPVLVVLSGLPGSGKSHLARELSRRFPLALLESDALRRALVKRPTYSQAESGRLFAACQALLDRLLAQRVPALLDATNLKEIYRRPLYRLAEKHDARLVLVQVEAPPRVVRRRLERRAAGENPWDRSEAGLDVYEKMRPEAEPIARAHIVVDTSGDISPALDTIVRKVQGDAA